MIMKTLHKICLSAILALTLIGSAAALPNAQLATTGLSAGKDTASGIFETQWANVEAFMNAHVVQDNPSTRNDLKNETMAGNKTWLVAGPELGWPTSIGSGSLTFDSVPAALICSVLIIAITP